MSTADVLLWAAAWPAAVVVFAAAASVARERASRRCRAGVRR